MGQSLYDSTFNSPIQQFNDHSLFRQFFSSRFRCPDADGLSDSGRFFSGVAERVQAEQLGFECRDHAKLFGDLEELLATPIVQRIGVGPPSQRSPSS